MTTPSGFFASPPGDALHAARTRAATAAKRRRVAFMFVCKDEAMRFVGEDSHVAFHPSDVKRSVNAARR
jgi:hypothetical protein